MINLSAAAGLSVFPDMASDSESLIRLADQEMYQLKWQLGHR
jgi:predicted signal transduction protein with EAL and GGDEF domain